MTIYFYKELGELGYLANYSNHGFTKNGIYYKTVEHYYQSEKMIDVLVAQKVILAETPKEASNIGRDRSNKQKPNWKNFKNDVMYEGILEKFKQNLDIKQKLIETRNEDIVEATIDEYYWGCGKDKSGENNIGKIIEKVRFTLLDEIFNSIFDIKALKKYDCIYITGHKKPDADSIFSSYLLKNILTNMNINSKFCILANDYEYSNEDIKLINAFLDEKPVIIDSIEDKNFILVDSNDPNQSIGDKYINNIIGSIDHHIYTGKVKNTLEIEYASTSLFIYDLFKNKYSFSDKEKELIALSVMADTEYLSSSRFKPNDKKSYDELKISLDLNRIKKEYFVTTDFSQDIKDNFYSSYKKYTINGKDVNKIAFKAYLEDQKHIDRYIDYTSSLDGLWLIIWAEYDTNKTHAILKGNTINKIEYDYILTSANLIMKDFENKGLL